jgi:hypothetical protein
MYFADRVVFHLATTVISLYKVEPLEGHQIPDPDNIRYTPKMLQYDSTSLDQSCYIDPLTNSSPIGFECRFVLRDEKARNLLRAISLEE